MIRVDQTSFGKPNGNCVPACLASILEVPLDGIPNFCARWADWVDAANRWLLPFDLWLLNVAFRDDGAEAIADGYHLIGGEGPRGRKHSVVGLGGKMVFDPHPSRDGLVTVEDYGFLVCRFKGTVKAAVG